jgi:hypothetical protein
MTSSHKTRNLILYSEVMTDSHKKQLSGFYKFKIDDIPSLEVFHMVNPSNSEITNKLIAHPTTILVVIDPYCNGWIGPAGKCYKSKNGIELPNVLTWDDVDKIIHQKDGSVIKFSNK